MTSLHSYFATSPKGMEFLLEEELKELGAKETKETRAGVSFQGDLELAYRACLWSRIANRVLLPIHKFISKTPEELYRGVQQIDWSEHLDVQGSLAIDFHSSRSAITHTHFGALKVKDAIVDQFREKYEVRPNIEMERPDLRLSVYLFNNEATVSIDLSGESLHRRGYRLEGTLAPLKENLAAAILVRAGWPEIAKQGGALIDPMCGSGTLAIEAALMAGDSAAGLMRTYFGFLRWKQHQPEIWDRLLAEAEEREKQGMEKIPSIYGYDRDPRAITTSVSNLERAGLIGQVHFEKQDITACQPLAKMRKQGLVVVNPPYGERMGEMDELTSLYSNLGKQLKLNFQGWQAAVFTGNPDLGKTMGLRSKRNFTLYNGALPCKLFKFDIQSDSYVDRKHELFSNPAQPQIIPQVASQVEGLVHRIQKNQKKLKGWLKQEGISCYRVYDHDLPEYAVAIDLYHDWVHVQEYEAPKTVDPQKAKKRLRNILDCLPGVFNIDPKQIFLKVRQKQRGKQQYEKHASEQTFYEVEEDQCKFLVNFTDYLDTGLFLDHRVTRKLVGEMAEGKHFLNLFAYTGSATVHAAKKGAKTTTTVDLSKSYLDWAEKNLALNGFSGKKHQFHRADCLEWMKEEKQKYDVIFLDPPTFSNSKKMEETFDIERDHVALIQSASNLLSKDGILIFSNNYRKFKMDFESLKDLKIEDWTKRTIPKDFSRNMKIHNCWKITLT